MEIKGQDHPSVAVAKRLRREMNQLAEDFMAARCRLNEVSESRSVMYAILEKYPPPAGVKWR